MSIVAPTLPLWNLEEAVPLVDVDRGCGLWEREWQEVPEGKPEEHQNP